LVSLLVFKQNFFKNVALKDIPKVLAADLHSQKSFDAAMKIVKEDEAGPQTETMTREPSNSSLDDLQAENRRLRSDLWKLESKCGKFPASAK
jgi:hypothetical protein